MKNSSLTVEDFDGKDYYYFYKECVEEAINRLKYAVGYSTVHNKPRKLISKQIKELKKIKFNHSVLTK